MGSGDVRERLAPDGWDALSSLCGAGGDLRTRGQGEKSPSLLVATRIMRQNTEGAPAWQVLTQCKPHGPEGVYLVAAGLECA